MLVFTLKRTLVALLVAVTVSIISFTLLRLSGDLAQALAGPSATAADVIAVDRLAGPVEILHGDRLVEPIGLAHGDDVGGGRRRSGEGLREIAREAQQGEEIGRAHV